MIAEQAAVTLQSTGLLTLNGKINNVIGDLNIECDLHTGTGSDGTDGLGSIYMPLGSKIYSKKTPLIGMGTSSVCFVSADNTISIGKYVELSGNQFAIKGNITAGVVDFMDMDEGLKI